MPECPIHSLLTGRVWYEGKRPGIRAQDYGLPAPGRWREYTLQPNARQSTAPNITGHYGTSGQRYWSEPNTSVTIHSQQNSTSIAPYGIAFATPGPGKLPATGASPGTGQSKNPDVKPHAT